MLHCRYLWLHNYNMTVSEVFGQINRPDLRASMVASLKLDPSTLAGNFDAWVDFLQHGGFWPACTPVTLAPRAPALPFLPSPVEPPEHLSPAPTQPPQAPTPQTLSPKNCPKFFAALPLPHSLYCISNNVCKIKPTHPCMLATQHSTQAIAGLRLRCTGTCLWSLTCSDDVCRSASHWS